MKLLHYTAPLLFILALVACQKPQPAAEAAPDAAAATTGVGEARPRLDASAVWNGSLDACRDAPNASESCLIDTLSKGGASPAALNAARLLAAQDTPGYVSAWQDQQGVGVATLTFPFRANTNQGTWLVDAAGRTIDVDKDILDDGIGTSAEYKAFHARHAASEPFAPATASGSEALPDGGLRLRYSTPLRTCHACKDDGMLTLAYDFDGQRRFVGKHLMELR